MTKTMQMLLTELRTELWFPDALVGASCWRALPQGLQLGLVSLSPHSLDLVCVRYMPACV